jgi:hypothetical protein
MIVREGEQDRRDLQLAILAGAFTVLVVGAAMWPYRSQYASLSFWLMAGAMGLGALGIFVLLVAGWLEGMEALKAFTGRGSEPERHSAARSGGSPKRPVAPSPQTGSRERSKRFAASLRQIPKPPPALVGRQGELVELRAAIGRGGVVISGPNGAGKTALALKLVDQLAAEYPDGRVFVDLRAASTPLTPERAMGHVIQGLDAAGRVPAAPTERGQLYQWVLHERRALLLLDDAANVEQVRSLVPPPPCALVITTRRPLQLPGMHTLELGPLGDEEARELLRAIVPDLGSEGAATIAKLCGHLPLALGLTAKALATNELAGDEYVRLVRDELERFDPVSACLSVSYELLDAGLQRAWARLGVFSIPFEREGAAAVWDLVPEAALETLEELTGRGLVVRHETTGRYALRSLARGMAYGKLREIEDPRPVHRQAAAHLETELSAKRRLTDAEMMEAVDQWERGEAWMRFARGTSGLMPHLYGQGYREEIERRLERALAAVQEHLDEPELASSLLHNLGAIAGGRDDF